MFTWDVLCLCDVLWPNVGPKEPHMPHDDKWRPPHGESHTVEHCVKLADEPLVCLGFSSDVTGHAVQCNSCLDVCCDS